jgi:hypothetical protein
MTKRNKKAEVLRLGETESSPGLSLRSSAAGPTLATAQGRRRVARTILDLIAVENRGLYMTLMTLPRRTLVGYIDRVLSCPISEANAWLAERADVPERSRSRFVRKVRQLARELIVSKAIAPPAKPSRRASRRPRRT